MVLAGLAGLGGCSVLPQTPYVQRRDWPLDVRRPTTAVAPKQGRVLLVRAVRAGPGLGDRGLRWLLPDGSVHVDFYEQWAVPPAEAVEDDTRRWLADSGLFIAVVATGSRLTADIRRTSTALRDTVQGEQTQKLLTNAALAADRMANAAAKLPPLISALQATAQRAGNGTADLEQSLVPLLRDLTATFELSPTLHQLGQPSAVLGT